MDGWVKSSGVEMPHGISFHAGMMNVLEKVVRKSIDRSRQLFVEM